MVEQPEQWAKIKDLFSAALEHVPGERAAFLRAACGTDESLRAEVESLLAANENPVDLSGLPFVKQVAQVTLENKAIGPYLLLRKLGEGGMGQVWLAEQSSPVRRQVAFKLIKTGMYDGALAERFKSERQSLAMMDHPSIAKVFDAGSTTDGQPYLVMEFVSGQPITDYCDGKKLKVRDRLELFIHACEAVQHAHQKAIVHRDLKPANILVTEVDGKAMPRIIDFGLAKALAPMAGDYSVTQAGVFIGTPGYMSPEQADEGVVDVDTRTDVYSLGVVLYVLLTGSLPLDPKQWKKRPLHEVLRQLREEEPLRPSTKVSTGKESSASVAEMRGTEVKQLSSLLRGDLDWIVMKALEKDRARRYGTPSELALDIRHYLNHEPVIARPASTGYRVQKYVRRHRVGVGATALSVALLAAFATAQEVQLRRITRERDRANRVTDFMTNMFKVSDPTEAQANTLTVREILDKASGDINSGLAQDPELQEKLMHAMGVVYMNLGIYPRSQELLERAADIGHHSLGASDPEALGAMKDLTFVLSQEGQLAKAEKLERDTLEVQRRVLGPENRDTLGTMENLAITLDIEGQHQEAEKIQRETLAIQQRTLGPESTDTLSSMSNLAAMIGNQGRFDEAEKLQRQTMEIEKRALGPDNLKTLSDTDNLAESLVYLGRYSEAEQLLRPTIETELRIVGPDNIETALARCNLAGAIAHQGRRDEAISLLQQAVGHGLRPDQDLEIESDPTLQPLHGDPRFAQIVAKAKQLAQAAQKPG